MADERREKYWSRFSTTYDGNQEYVAGKELLDEVKIHLNKLDDLGEVLELGCGTGIFTETIAKNSKHVYATDLSDELLSTARKKLSNVEQVTFQKEDCMGTSFASNKFDTVFMANLIHVVEDPLRTLQESYRVLKNDGLLIVATFTNSGMKPLEKIKLGFRFIKVWGKPPKHTHFSPDSLGSTVKYAGFSIEELKLLGDRTKSIYLIGRKNITE